jgi:hypothetical protein
MARTRTTKKLAQRIDLNYFKRPTPLKRAKFWLSLFLPLLALIWISWRGFSGDHSVYSSGRMSRAHAVLEKECAACHDRVPGEFSAKANMFGCLSCHDGPMHHSLDLAKNDCITCHTEHRGRINIAAASNQACAACHADLQPGNRMLVRYAPHIRNFEEGHPEFAALRPAGATPPSDPGTIRLNHAIHMKPIRRGPNGPLVNLDCSDCHRPAVVNAKWNYADAAYAKAAVTYSDQEEQIPVNADTLGQRRPDSGRELMAPVKFAASCAACHLLTFDKRFDEGVPHDQPRVVFDFLVKKFQDYIAAHPQELRELRDPDQDLAEQPLPPRSRAFTPNEWVSVRLRDSLQLLWRKTCKQCHTLTFGLRADGLPIVAEAKTIVRWMPHAKFDHDAHRGFACVSCHAKALTSTESSDILLPRIATCKTCHAPGPDHADSRCSECHTYHDWSKRKEVTPKFTLPALRVGGQ